MAGESWMEHPLECCDGIVGSDNSLVAYQHRFYNRASCHRDSDYRRNDVLVYHHNRLPASQAYPWGASSPTPMDSWPFWHGNQHRGTVLPMPGVRICFLPAYLNSGARQHELVRSDVRGNYHHRCGLLSVTGTTLLHSSRGSGEARDVSSTHVYNCKAVGRGELVWRVTLYTQDYIQDSEKLHG